MDNVKNLLDQLSPIIREDEEKETKRMEKGFNLFYLISDHYYRETFHSDIIAALLSPKENHGGGNLYLDLFLDMIEVDKSKYQNAEVYKEYGTNDGTLGGRIDIFIEGEDKHCVVIENKLNNAGDTYRQLPKYYHYLKINKNIIDKFVYLPLDPSKTPDKFEWNDEERKFIDGRLIIIPAFQEDRQNFINNWLEIAERKTTQIETRVIIKQYISVLYNLSLNTLNTTTMKKFYDFVLDEDNLKSVMAVRQMLNDLPQYLASRIQERYGDKCTPFSKIWIWKPRDNSFKDAVFEGAIINNIYLKIDILCNEYGYTVWFNNPPQYYVAEQDFSDLVTALKSLKDFEADTNAKNRMIKHFAFTDEKGLFSFIESILVELSAMVKK